MKVYVDKVKLQEYTTKLTAKFKTIFALKGETVTDAQVAEAVTDWLDANVPTGTTVVVDKSLSVDGAAADAKKTGDIKDAMGLIDIPWESGGMYQATGIEYNDGTKSRTKFIPVNPNEVLCIKKDSSISNFYVAEFASNETTTSSVNTQLAFGSYGKDYGFYKVGSGTHYIRLQANYALSSVIGNVSLFEVKKPYYLNALSTVVGFAGPAVENAIYLEEGNASGTSLYFKINRSSIQFFDPINGQTAKSMATIISDLGASTVMSAFGVPDCLSIPNNNALVFDSSDAKMKYVLRTEISPLQIVLFYNSYGRAENPHPLILEAKTFSKPFVNVMDFGARGTGQVDDTQAIQAALESVKTKGGTVYFPSGTYLVNTLLFDANTSGVSSALHVYSNTKILLDKNAVIKRGTNVNHLLYTHNESNAAGYAGCSNIEICGGTIDENSVVQNNCTSINLSHGSDIYIHDMRFVGGGSSNTWHYIEINSSKNVKIENCKFETALSKIEAIQIDDAKGQGNLGVNDNTVCQDIMIVGCYFDSGAHPAIGNHSNAAHHDIRIHDCVFYNNNSRGAIAFWDLIHAIDIYNCTFYENTYAVNLAANQPDSLFRDNRLLDVTTPVNNCMAKNNMINGVYTA